MVLHPGSVNELEYKQVITDKQLREIEEKYGDSSVTGLKVGMGAESIRELLMAVDLEKESELCKKILEEGQFAEDQNIPSGVVYQIQIFATKNKARTKDIKGLSPVYESRGANGHYVYRVGVFRTYNDVLSHLNAVKKVGFKSAYIVSFIDGKTVKLATAKAKEAAQKSEPVFYEVRVIPADGPSFGVAPSGT